MDTHVLIWIVENNPTIPPRVALLIKSTANHVFVSAATPWEIAIKVRAGKLTFDSQFLSDFDNRVAALAFSPLAIKSAHAIASGALAGGHQDPFDRMLVAQAQVEQLAIVSRDPALSALGAHVIW